MQISSMIPADRQVIEAYGGGGFRVSGVRFEGSVIVLPERTLNWPVTSTAALDIASLAPVAEAEETLEILLLGCGAQNTFIDPELRAALKARGLSIDGMDTGAACRTYNVLLGEGRQVAAALIALD